MYVLYVYVCIYIYIFIYLCIYLFIYLFIYSFIHSFIHVQYLFIQPTRWDLSNHEMGMSLGNSKQRRKNLGLTMKFGFIP